MMAVLQTRNVLYRLIVLLLLVGFEQRR